MAEYLIFLILRFTGARLSEVINLNYEDLDFRSAEVKLITLKRYNKANNYRIVPITPNAMSEIATYIAQYPEMKDILFKLNSSFFYRVFKGRCIPKDLCTPAHIEAYEGDRAFKGECACNYSSRYLRTFSLNHDCYLSKNERAES